MKSAVVILLLAGAAAAEWPAPDKLPLQADWPSPLKNFDGKAITSLGDWQSKRKPELKALFEEYMYGWQPVAPANLTSHILHTDAKALGGKATLREIELRFDYHGKTNPTPIRLLIVTPNNAKASPCFVGINFQGNHTLTDDPKVRLPDTWMYEKYPGVVKNRATDAGRGKVLDVWPFEQIIDRGYAVATFYSGDIQPDRPGVKEGFRATLAEESPNSTACIMSWAWGVSRAVDYLVSDPAVDAKRIAVVGHSRLGKVALVAGAFDERIALIVPNQAGCGGSGPSRHTNAKAESVTRINKSFPHWFCGNFKYFGEHLDQLPFDQHALVALCAPRPVLFTNAAEDHWANPAGQFDVLQAATPVYKLHNVEGLKGEKPETGKLLDSRLGYFLREGKHSMTPADWKIYLDFADKWLPARP